MYGLCAPEALISGIPFSTMSRCSGSQVLEAISSALAPGGTIRGIPGEQACRLPVPAHPRTGADGGGTFQHTAATRLPVGKESRLKLCSTSNTSERNLKIPLIKI